MINDGTPEYRFAPPGPRDEAEEVATCGWCGYEINVGDTATEFYEYSRVHSECEHAFIESIVIKERGTINADGSLD